MNKTKNEYYDPVFDEPVVVNVDTPEGKAFLEAMENPSEPNEHLKKLMSTPTLYGEDAKSVLKETFEVSPEQLEKVKERLEKAAPICFKDDSKIEFIPRMYQMIASVDELHWFFDHVLVPPQVHESYSAVFVSRHKKLTKEEQETIGLTRKESEFLATQTFRVKGFKNLETWDEDNAWTFENFLKRIRRFNVDKYAYTTALGEPIPTKTLAIIFYVNPCDDTKVTREFVNKYLDTQQTIAKGLLSGHTYKDMIQQYQWYGNAESVLKHLKANQKGTSYWMDFDIDVPKWFKEDMKENRIFLDRTSFVARSIGPYECLLLSLSKTFGKGNYVVVDTSGGYHVLVKTSAIRSNPHDFCKTVQGIYDECVRNGAEPYLDEKGNCKFECIVNDSQIPGLPLPGTYQYGREVRVINKEDFND